MGPQKEGGGTNRYGYSDNDLMKKSDPSGHTAIDPGAEGFADGDPPDRDKGTQVAQGPEGKLGIGHNNLPGSAPTPSPKSPNVTRGASLGF